GRAHPRIARGVEVLRADPRLVRRVAGALAGHDPRPRGRERGGQVHPHQDDDGPAPPILRRDPGGWRGSHVQGDRRGAAQGCRRHLPGAHGLSRPDRGREHLRLPPRPPAMDRLAPDGCRGRRDDPPPWRDARPPPPRRRADPGRAADRGDRPRHLARGARPHHGRALGLPVGSRGPPPVRHRPQLARSGRGRALHLPPAGGCVRTRRHRHRRARRPPCLHPAHRRRHPAQPRLRDGGPRHGGALRPRAVARHRPDAPPRQGPQPRGRLRGRVLSCERGRDRLLLGPRRRAADRRGAGALRRGPGRIRHRGPRRPAREPPLPQGGAGPGHRLCVGGPAQARPRPHRIHCRQHHAPHARRLCDPLGPPRPPARGRGRRALPRRHADQSGRPRRGGGHAVGRQPAEGHAGQVAQHQSAPPHRGRAHARHRRGRQGRGPPHPARPRGAGGRDPRHLLRPARGPVARRPRPRHARRPPRGRVPGTRGHRGGGHAPRRRREGGRV
ncbi:MAG: ABC transporter, ATP-binding protein (cluster 2, ribose/xylose/arabinose/galactose) / ABC transporter, ATP-binding protein (cluster 2, ribose/xylose/arabinose/galactose), partial [uncultured Rubellimicrobium sp.]